MRGAVLLHPDRREVIPLMPEPIIKQDGTEKNDCERNAAKRLIVKLRQDHPHLKLIVTEDSLSWGWSWPLTRSVTRAICRVAEPQRPS